MESNEEAEPRRRRRRGGIQQRLARERGESQVESAVLALLMFNLAAGLLSGVRCHEIAKAAQIDNRKAREGYEFPELDRLADIKHGKNLSSSVEKILADQSKLPMPMEVDMPYTKGNSKALITVPHEMFAALFSETRAWAQCILPSTEKLENLWFSFSSHPCMEGHPAKQVANWMRTFVPIELHGDEVPVIGVGKVWCFSALAFSWMSLIAHGLGSAVQDDTFYIWGVFEKFMIPSTDLTLGTMATLFRIMRWSFNAMYEGTWPTHDWRGIKQLLHMLNLTCSAKLLVCVLLFSLSIFANLKQFQV